MYFVVLDPYQRYDHPLARVIEFQDRPPPQLVPFILA
jgi:hypothetical protein